MFATHWYFLMSKSVLPLLSLPLLSLSLFALLTLALPVVARAGYYRLAAAGPAAKVLPALPVRQFLPQTGRPDEVLAGVSAEICRPLVETVETLNKTLPCLTQNAANSRRYRPISCSYSNVGRFFQASAECASRKAFSSMTV